MEDFYTNINVIPDLLSISLYGGFNSFESKGNSYLHHYTAWYVGGDASLNYKNFFFIWVYRKPI